MNKNVLLSIFVLAGVEVILLVACKIQPGSTRYYDDNNPNRVYHLRLNPAVGSQYQYTVSRSTEFHLEAEGKKVDNVSRSTIVMTYSTDRDSAGNIVLKLVYNKIHLYSKDGDTEEEQDADKASESTDPVEKMLGILRGANLRAVASPAGQVKSMHGDDEIKNKLLEGFGPDEAYAKGIASQQWDRQVKEGLLKNSMEQLFNIFPDSAMHVGDRWKLSSTQHEQIDLVTTASCQLKEIVDGTAVIWTEGDISSDHGAGTLNGTNYTADLKGKQESDLAMETTTGMLLSNTSDSKITGTISSMGRDVPVKISISTKLVGRRVK